MPQEVVVFGLHLVIFGLDDVQVLLHRALILLELCELRVAPGSARDGLVALELNLGYSRLKLFNLAHLFRTSRDLIRLRVSLADATCCSPPALGLEAAERVARVEMPQRALCKSSRECLVFNPRSYGHG